MSVTGAADKEVPPAAACDSCAVLPAVVYCRADAARLCLPCDRHVHGANTVATRHARAPLCAGCRAAAAASRSRRRGVFLCANCHFEEEESRGDDGGDPEPPLHDRGAVEGYAGCPSIAELAVVLGVGGCESDKAAAAGDGDGDGWWWPASAWEEPQVLRLEDVIVQTTSCHGLQPLLTPSSSPKNRRSSGGGELTEEVIRQLGELAKSEAAAYAAEMEMEAADGEQQLPSWWAPSHFTTAGHGDFWAFDTAEACNGAATVAVTPCEHDIEAWIATDDACRTEAAQEPAPAPEPCLSPVVEKTTTELWPDDPDTAVVGDAAGTATPPEQAARPPPPPPPAMKQLGGYDVEYPDRGMVISRYKEKRKNRRFDKQIRYESRKARADGRTRIKGRFAKSSGKVVV
ncbi:hypothetical protein U9M48_016139 [Paspalum notatum var. saurae]|uniref:Uncharacterized protein n=1 Tax=Paspalum notatum var. saurae TaxID=547442 RepID=A0AAQ3T8F4_PASNO